MAIYHFSGTVISRSQGRSAVACAAYRAGERLLDERYGKEHDYSKKADVLHREILLPEGAPAEFLDRGVLWNAVEACEKRKDAQLAREFNFALPRELSLEQNILLAREFVQETFVGEGMIADLCLHSDKGSDGEPHPHAHVMLTMREVGEAGFGPKVRSWNDKALLLSWREGWAEVANRHLVLNGFEVTIDHRSFADQGIGLEPQHKIGSVVARDKLARLEDHQRIARENGEKLLSDPSIALHAITRQQSTFRLQDMARFVNRHTVDAEQFSLVYERVKSHESVVSLGVDDRGVDRYTTLDMLTLERGMITCADILSRSTTHSVTTHSAAHSIATDSVATHSIAPMMRVTGLSQKQLSEEQRGVFDHLMESGDLSCVVGFAGTGKSYLLGSAREAWEEAGYRVHGVTLSGIAAENLEGSSGIASRTYASRCYYWDKGEQGLGSRDVLVVDEAAMLSSRQMARLMDVAVVGGAKVVLVGDPQQLQAIEAGAAFRAIAGHVGYVELTEIRRQAIAWQREATKEFALGRTAEALRHYEAHANVHELETQAVAKTALVELWNDARLSDHSQTQIMLAYNKVDVLELNQLARGLRQAGGELGPDVMFKTDRGERAFAEHDRVYFLKNDRALGVMNGTLGTVESIKDGEMTIRLDKDRSTSTSLSPTIPSSLSSVVDSVAIDSSCIRLTVDRYNHLDHGYAATVHKAQGVTVDRSYVLASKYLDLHSTYVAMSRHRQSVDLFYGKDVFLTRGELIQTVSRDRSKDVTLDYLHNQALTGKTAWTTLLERPEKGVTLEQSALSLHAELSDREEGLAKQRDSESIASILSAHSSLSSPLSDSSLSVSTEHPSAFHELANITREETRRMQQEKLQEFTRLAQEQMALSKGSRGSPTQDAFTRVTSRGDFSEFKRQFEANNPELAKELRQKMVPATEREAIALAEAQRARDSLPRILCNGEMVIDFDKIERNLKAKVLAYEVAERKAAAEQANEKTIEPKVRQPVKGLQKELQKDRGFDLEL